MKKKENESFQKNFQNTCEIEKKLYLHPLERHMTLWVERVKNKKNTFLDILNWQPF
jgi:hypothetical protein